MSRTTRICLVYTDWRIAEGERHGAFKYSTCFVGASNDRRFRAFDSRTGKELWVTKLDYSALSVPITYEGRNGKQYVAFTAAGGGGITDPNPANTESLHVFALP